MLNQLLKDCNYHNLFVIWLVDRMRVDVFLIYLENGDWSHLDKVAAFIAHWLI